MKLISTAQVMVLSIASIAILIAIVGVINTILTSVMERFQEIGILKTVGAMPWDIFKLVWIETLILCTTGGILGIILALILSRVTDVLMRSVLPYAPSGGLVIIDFKLILTTLLGIIWHRPPQRRLSSLESRQDPASGSHQSGVRMNDIPWKQRS